MRQTGKTSHAALRIDAAPPALYRSAPMADRDPKPDQFRPLARYAGQKPPAPDWFGDLLESPSAEGRTPVEGAEIAWRRWGAPGDPGLILIHGGAAHKGWWDFIGPSLARDGRCVAAFDLSGMGDSDWRDAYAMPVFAEEVMAVAEAAGLMQSAEKLTVVGHSFGGWVTLQTVRDHGGRLKCAITLDSPLKPPTDKRRGTPPTRPGRAYDSFEAGLARFRLLPDQSSEHDFILDYIARAGLQRATQEDGGEGWTWKFDPELWNKMRHEDGHPSERKPDPNCPLATFRGADSALVVDSVWDYMRTVLPEGAPMVSIPAAQHHLFLDQPVATITGLRALLAGWPR